MTWLNCNQRFVATNATTTFTLRNADPGSDYSSAIDNVSFVRIAGGTSPAVPEPATWALLLIGVGATGCALRRRQAVNVSASMA